MKKKNFILSSIIVGIACLCFGCGQKPKEEKVVARVNDYVMTVKDLEEEIRNAPYVAEEVRDLEKVLDLAVRKQVLIQEAQRQGLDRKKSFMETIERYWEQALIKELLQKETGRIYENVGKEKQNKALDDWLEELYKKADIEIYENVLTEVGKKK